MDAYFKQIREIYGLVDSDITLPLSEPILGDPEKRLLNECIDSGFVSSAGAFVNAFEDSICAFTGASQAIAITNGTCALHLSLLALDVQAGDEVLTQPLSFVATSNAIAHSGAEPVYIDIDAHTLGLSAQALDDFLNQHTQQKDGLCVNVASGRIIRACMPAHIFGHACEIDTIVNICRAHNIAVIEDAAEALGSYYKGKHLGNFGAAGIFSFNGNKIITTGGGGMIVTNDIDLAARLRHLSTTAKMPHPYEYLHDAVGYNYRLPNINAALGCAQMQHLSQFLEQKRRIAQAYTHLFAQDPDIDYFSEPQNCLSNYWLNTLVFKDSASAHSFIEDGLTHNIQCRPAWRLLCDLPMFQHCQTDGLSIARTLGPRLVNIPSSANATQL